MLTTESKLRLVRKRALLYEASRGLQKIVDGVVQVVVHVIVAPSCCQLLSQRLGRKELPSRAVLELKLVVTSSTRFQCF